MVNITVDFNKVMGRIKPMHGVGQPPFQGTNFTMFKYLKEAGIPYSRLHDVGGVYGGGRWVDIPNIFRDFSADPEDPEAYDFVFTDLLINALVEAGVEPFFRLGVGIENAAAIKAYRIYPPEDYDKWASVCEHIIRHYTEGWANGFHHKIEYWEIWNEPDNYEDIYENQMWRGTKEQYYELYKVASLHLKKCFPHLKIGGYASCGFYSIMGSYVKEAVSSPRTDYFIDFFDGFLNYIKENNCPLDFFSWHSYDNIKNNVLYADYARKKLDEAGYTETETSCNEWNSEQNKKGTFEHAAVTCGMMLSFQDTPLDSAMFYDARFGTSLYGALFNPLTAEPFPAYYAFKAYNRLYTLENQVYLEKDNPEIYAAAAANGGKGHIVISNPSGESIPLDIKTKGKITSCLLTAENQLEQKVQLPSELPAYSIISVCVDL